MATSSEPLVSISTLSSGDAVAAGQTLRALAHEGRPNAETAAILGRVGDWLVAAAMASATKPGEPQKLTIRASDLLTRALVDAKDDATEAMAALTGAAFGLATKTDDPVASLASVIKMLAEGLSHLPPKTIVPITDGVTH